MGKNSEEIYARSCLVMPGGVSSPVRSWRHLKMAPMIVASGKRDLIYDVEGREFIDFCGSWGALILGHASDQIIQGVIEQIRKGTSFGIATEIEEQLAAQIVRLVPSIEKLRFVNSGTEATMTAMRLARGYTERTKVIKFTGHYHGHNDSLLIQAGSGVTQLNPLATSKGVNPSVIADTLCLPFNDFAKLRSFFRNSALASQVAAVILEPITGNMGVVLPEKGFLEVLREETKRNGSLLIFDEVITGFRVGLRGAQGLYGLEPDLTCLGKVIGGGFPVALVGGKREILDHLAPLGQVYQAGTLSGNPVAMRAGLETLKVLEQKGFYENLEQKAKKLAEPIEEALLKKGAPACLQRQGSMLTLFFGLEKVSCKEDLQNLDEERFTQFFRYLFERGIYLSPSPHEAWFISAAHTDDHLERAANEICTFIREFL